MRNLLLFLLILLSGCDEEAQSYSSVSGTDTFLQRMASSSSLAGSCSAKDSTLDCETVLYWMLLTSELSKKNTAYDTVLHIRPHTYNIAHTIGNNDSMLIWINYRPDDTTTIKTIAWLQMDMKTRQLYDVTYQNHKYPIVFDTAQLSAIHCNCIYAGNNKSNAPQQLKMQGMKLIRNKRYTDEPDYGKVF